MLGSDGGAGAAEQLGGAASASEDCQQQRPVVPSSGGCKPTPHSIRIVSMQYSNTATTTTCGGAGGYQELGTVRATTTPFFCSHIWSCAAKAFPIGGLSPILFLLLPLYRMPVYMSLSRHRQRSDLPACILSCKTCIYSTYIPSSFSHTSERSRSSRLWL